MKFLDFDLNQPRPKSKDEYFDNFLDEQCELHVFWSDIASH